MMGTGKNTLGMEKMKPGIEQAFAIGVELYLNRRLRFLGIHDLDAVIAALKSWTTALFSWKSFTLNFVIRNPY
jgi:hypothetical protein